MKLEQTLFLAVAALAFPQPARADIKAPTKVTCTVTSVTPANAAFFSFSKTPLVGDQTTFDLADEKIDGISFTSGAHIGSTVRKHPLLKQPSFEGMSFYEVNFKSTANGQNYTAVLVAQEAEKNISATVDVLEKQNLGRLVLNSVEMACVRQ